ncbi:PEGA domain-containing protein [Nitrospira defluvii]|uniref:PEGA domain-containing protein n=2 Tax=Nitrospira defluvii TaxID=330214 RepID=A0ABM8QU18_9BACT|nr:PEGA domain-containing protein [Nitrospira defluvii]
MARGWHTMAALTVVAMMTSGCATIVHLGSNEELSVSSEPPGATVVIDGTERGVTPLATKVERKKDHAVVLTKEGFEENQSRVESHISWWIAGNVILGGLVGILVDVMSGGGYTIEPDKVAVTLKPVEGGGSSPAPSLSSLTQSPPIP